MATPVIKLEPIRMGSLLATSSSAGQKYIAPGRRGAVEETGPIKVDLGVDNFPTLGSAPKKVSGWGKHTVKATAPVELSDTVSLPEPSKVSDTMRDKIKEQIRQTELEEEERKKPKEDDPYKMTRAELLEGGWAILSLKPESVREAVWRLNVPFTKAWLTSEDYYE